MVLNRTVTFTEVNIMFKRYASTALTAAMLFCTSAQAEAPASQFGFTIWPYRQQTECDIPAFPTYTPEIGDEGDQTGPLPSSVPTKEPTATTSVPSGTPEATAAPTMEPQQTVIPTAEITAKPTMKPTVTQAPSPDDDYTTDSISMQEQTAWNLLNADRKANGLPALMLDSELSRIARIKSEDMRDKGYFAHESPTYGNVRDMLRYFGYSFSAAGENIAHHATVTKAQAAFMSSDGHRRNILSSSWTRAGIGVCYDAQGYVYVTQIFAR